MTMKGSMPCATLALPRLDAGSVPRGRLLDKLIEIENRKLAILCAPAGFGKTTAMLQLRQRLLAAGGTVIWLSFQQDRFNSRRHRRDIVAAFCGAGVLPDTNIVGSEADGLSRDLLLGLADGVARYSQEIYLFADDTHRAGASVQSFLCNLLDVSAPNFHLILSSRQPVPCPLGKLRSHHQLIEIGSDLKFDIVETRSLVRQCGKLLPEREESIVRAVYETCGGWPVSVALQINALKSRSHTLAVDDELADCRSELIQYIEAEIFSEISECDMRLWERLSICQRFSLELAFLLLRPADPSGIMRLLSNESLLLSPIDQTASGYWYRHHSLFAELLRERLLINQAERVAILHSDAAKWFSDHGHVVEAIHHARLVADIPRFEALLDRMPIGLRSLSWIDVVRDMLSDLDPASLTSMRAKLIGSWAFIIGGDVNRARPWMLAVLNERAENDEFAGHQMALRATMAFLEDDSDLFFVIYKSLGDTRDCVFIRQIMSAQGMSLLNALGDYERARRIVANRGMADESLDDLALLMQIIEATSYLFEGDVHEAVWRLRSLRTRIISAHGDLSVAANVCAAYLSEACYEIDELDEARDLLSGREPALRTTSAEPLTAFLITQSRVIRASRGESDAIHFLLARLELARRLPGKRALGRVLAEAATAQLREYGAAVAEPLRAELASLAADLDAGTGVLAEVAALHREVDGRFHLRGGRFDAALEAFDDADKYCASVDRLRMQIRIRLLKAAALFGRDELDAADANLIWSVENAQRLGLYRTFSDELPDIKSLLSARVPVIRVTAVTRAYIKVVCAPLFGRTDAESARLTQQANEVLTNREADIVRLVSQSMSNKRIALALDISPATVKWNLRNVFQKLNVTTRYEVVIWARRRLDTRQS